jgi:hypothetical protein
MGGGTRAKPCIWFSGFWSQGDGAAFEGNLNHAKGVTASIRDYAPQDTTLHGIADRFQAIQRRNFYQLAAEASHRSLLSRILIMSVDVSRFSDQPPTDDAEEVVTEIFRDQPAGSTVSQAEYDHLTE